MASVSGVARFLENVFVILSSCFTQWEVVVVGRAERGHQRPGPVVEEKGAKMGPERQAGRVLFSQTITVC